MKYLQQLVYIALSFFTLCPVESSLAAPAPLVVQRLSAKLGCALFSENGKFKLGSLSAQSVFKAYSKNKIASNPRKYSKASAQCKRLKGLGIRLKDLPSAVEAFGSESSGVGSVSGTPPALSTLSSGGAAPYFWRSGVLNRIANSTPTADDCEEFFGSELVARSAGLAACRVGEDIGQSIFVGKAVETIGCYLKEAISSTTYGRGLTLVSGSIPGGLVDALLDPPTGRSARVIKIAFSGLPGEAFLKIKSASQNATDGNDYSLERWSCTGGALTQYQVATVRSSDSLYTSTTKMSSLGAGYSADIVGYLTPDGGGGIELDRTRSRSISMVSAASTVSFSSDLSIDDEGIYRQKIALNSTTQRRHAYEISRVSGASESDLSLRETAVTFRILESSTEIAGANTSAEFQDTSYVSAVSTTLSSGLSAVNLTTDPFYSTTPSTGFDSSAYDCNETPDIELSLDFTASAVTSAVTGCVLTPTPFTNICSDSNVLFGEIQYSQLCPS